MAMILCPECGKEISDKAKKCIHCGKVFIEEEVTKKEIICSECGTILSESDEICFNCGYPIKREINEDGAKPQQVEVASIKMAKKTKKVVIGIFLFWYFV